MIGRKNPIGMILGLALGLTVTCHADASWNEETPSLQYKQDRNQTRGLPQTRTPPPDIHVLSEAFGHYIGKDMRDQGIDLDVRDVIAGLEAGVQGKPPPVSEAEYDDMMGHYRDRGLQERAKANLLVANAFLKSNARNEGVREVIPGKLQYKILKTGRGAVVQEDGTPQMHYTGQFIDGCPFGGAEASRNAISVHLPDMIRGFQQGVAGMHEGEKRRIYVHPDLAYGIGKEVPPNSILFFDVEVLSAGPNRQKQTQLQQALSQPIKPTKPAPAPVAIKEEIDEWDLPLDNTYEEEEEDNFSTQPFQLHSVQRQNR